MNCKNARKYLYAFADSQLSVKANCEILDHLKMCPACSRIVNDHQSLREALRRTAERIGLPVGLEARVRRAIWTGRHVPHDLGTRPRRRYRMAGGFALAACVVLGFAAAWHLRTTGSDPAGPAPDLVQAKAPIEAEKVASMIAAQHDRCEGRCKRQVHHNLRLPRNPDRVAQAIRSHFEGQLAAAAPDLSEHGFKFDSASFCCFTGDPSCISAHVMYVDAKQDAYLSFFSVPRMDRIDEGLPSGPPDRVSPFIYAAADRDEPLTVAAWHEKQTTYFCSGPMEPARLQEMVAEIQLALRQPQRRVMLASILGAQ